MFQALRQPAPRERFAPWEHFSGLFTLVTEFGVGASSEACSLLHDAACALIEEHGRSADRFAEERASAAVAARDFEAAMYWTAVRTSIGRCRQA